VLKDGHVSEVGTHAELLEQNGIYAELWNGMCSTSPARREDLTLLCPCSPRTFVGPGY
jgi:hypothetical protein